AQNAQAVDHGRMAVGTDTTVRIDNRSIVVFAFPDDASDVLEMQLVHDALSGWHHLDAVKTAAAPAQEGESFSVTLVFARQVDFCGGRVGPAIYLQGVINDDVNGDLRGDPGGIATCVFDCFAHGGHVEQHDQPQDILTEHAGRVESDAIPGSPL